MAFKLSKQACIDIIKGDYTLAYNEELERLRLKLEQTVNQRDTDKVQGQIYQLRQHMGLRKKAHSQNI